MRVKRLGSWMTMLLLLLALSGCTLQKSDTAEAEKAYQSAIALLQTGKYDEAGAGFAALGHYYDASRYAMYCQALSSAEKGEYDTAVASLSALSGFMDSDMMAVYYTGRAYEARENYEQAREVYAAILQFGDVSTRVAEIPGKILERDYQYACSLEAAGWDARAMEAFQALKGYSDSNARIAAIQERMNAQAYADADEMEKAGRLEDARNAFVELGTYSDSAKRVVALDEAIRDERYRAAVAAEEQDNLVDAYNGYLDLGDYADAAQRADAIREEALYRSAMMYVNSGSYQQAMELYRQLGDYKDSAEKARLLGVCDLAWDSRRLNPGVVAFKLQGSWGYIDLVNNRDIGPVYASIGAFSDTTGLSIVSYNSIGETRYGLMNREGGLVTKTGYRALAEGEKGYYTGVNKDTSGTYLELLGPDGSALSRWSELGNTRASAYYTLSGPSFTNGVMIARTRAGKCSLLNDSFEPVIENAEDISLISRNSSQDTVLVKWSDKAYQLMELDGTPLDDNRWVSIAGFKDGYAQVQGQNGLYGFIRQSDGLVAVEPQYEEVQDFAEGYAGVKLGGNWGFINTEGETVIEPKYAGVSSFSGDQCIVRDWQLGYQVIDKTGRLLLFKQDVYRRADSLDKAGEYEQAITAFESLEGYGDSDERALQAREKINANVYAFAESLENEGKYLEAADTFTWLGEYSDAPARAAAAVEKQNETTYESAAALEQDGQLEDAIAIYLTLGDYRGSAQHAADLREGINQGICQTAADLENGGQYEAAIDVLNQIPDYAGVAEHIAALEEKIRQRDYNAAAALEDEGKFEEAIVAFTAMGDYSDSVQRIAGLEEKIRQRDYNAAAALEAAGDYAAAYDAYVALGDYADSAERAGIVTELAAEQKRRMTYETAVANEMNGELKAAAEGYASLAEYEDAAQRLSNVEEMLRALDYKNAVQAIAEERYEDAVALLTPLGDYERSKALLKAAQTGISYQKAVADALAGKLQQAYEEFLALGDFGDSAKKAEIVGNLSRADSTTEIAEGVLIYDFHDQWGIANLNQNVITPARYTSIRYEQGAQYAKYGLMRVYMDHEDDAKDAYGYVDMNGKEIIPCAYFRVTDFNASGLCTVAKWGGTIESSYVSYKHSHKFLFGIMNYMGNTITSAQWRTMGTSTNDYWGYEGYSVYESYCVIDKPVFKDGRMKVQNADGKWGIIDANGRVLGQVKWDQIGDFSDGMAMVAVNTGGSIYNPVYKYGFINESGQTIGEVRWEEVRVFSNGYAAVKEKGYWGFINKQNVLVIPCQYAEVSDFREDGTCDVKNKDGTWQVINTSGEVSFF